jgi:hypothetical protein
MLRCVRFFSDCLNARDYLGAGFLLLILAVIGWTLSIIFSPTMRDMAMKRFHLGSDNFGLWAAHQSVPAMYNFENRIQFTNELLDDAPFDPTEKTYEKRTLNHFPARFITFGDQLASCFSNRREGTFEMSSIFGDTELVTRWKIQRRPHTTGASTANSQATTMVIERISQCWNPAPKLSQQPLPTSAGTNDE